MQDLAIYHKAVDAIAYIREQEIAKKALGKSYVENVVKLYVLTLLTLNDMKATSGKRDKKATQLQTDFKAAGMTAAKAKRLIELTQGMRRKDKAWAKGMSPDEMMDEFKSHGLKSESEIKKYVVGAEKETFEQKVYKLISKRHKEMCAGYVNGKMATEAFDKFSIQTENTFKKAMNDLWLATENLAGESIDEGETE